MRGLSTRMAGVLACIAISSACGSGESSEAANGGVSGTGGTAGTTGGAPPGGTSSTGAAPSTGGTIATGGVSATGGGAGSGGSPSDGCGTAGWQSAFVEWNSLGYGNVRDGGFTVCFPSAWALEPQSGQPPLLRHSTTSATIALGGELRLDHADAVTRLTDEDAAWCTAGDYTYEYTSIDGWPALQHRYTFTPPACGACPGPTPTALLAVATFVATGDFLVRISAQMPVTELALADTVFAIGRTTVADNVGTPDLAQTADEVSALEIARHDTCLR